MNERKRIWKGAKMKLMHMFLPVLALAALSFSISGCASIVRGSRQDICIESVRPDEKIVIKKVTEIYGQSNRKQTLIYESDTAITIMKVPIMELKGVLIGHTVYEGKLAGKISLKRKYLYVLYYDMDNEKPKYVIINRKLDFPWYTLLGFVPGILVDGINGTWFKLEPEHIQLQ